MTKTTIQIRFADIDSLGHVNNVNLQHFFDVGKSDYFRSILKVTGIGGEVGIITAATNTSYLGQTRFEDNVYVETSVSKIGNKSFTMSQRIVNADTGAINAESTSVMVAFDFKAQQSIPVPQEWRDKMTSL